MAYQPRGTREVIIDRRPKAERLEAALLDLLLDIDDGGEYPDAHWRCTVRHQVDAQALQDAYDNRS